jgi:hypothetical protein
MPAASSTSMAKRSQDALATTRRLSSVATRSPPWNQPPSSQRSRPTSHRGVGPPHLRDHLARGRVEHLGAAILRALQRRAADVVPDLL